MIVQSIRVVGMTCGHCVAAVTEELEVLSGVHGVAVDLASGRVDLTADAPLPPGALAAAVSEAGYALAPGTPPAVTGAR